MNTGGNFYYLWFMENFAFTLIMLQIIKNVFYQVYLELHKVHKFIGSKQW